MVTKLNSSPLERPVNLQCELITPPKITLKYPNHLESPHTTAPHPIPNDQFTLDRNPKLYQSQNQNGKNAVYAFLFMPRLPRHP